MHNCPPIGETQSADLGVVLEKANMPDIGTEESQTNCLKKFTSVRNKSLKRLKTVNLQSSTFNSKITE